MVAPFRFSSASSDGSVSVIAALPLIGIHSAYTFSTAPPTWYHITNTTPPLPIIVRVGVRLPETLCWPEGTVVPSATVAQPAGLVSVSVIVTEVHGHARTS